MTPKVGQGEELHAREATPVPVGIQCFDSRQDNEPAEEDKGRERQIRGVGPVESVFRHIAMGRRCWLNSGSHEAATNIAFMYSLYESCKMNDIDFGEYVEDILTRMMNGDDDYRSMIPCNYTQGKKYEKKVA